MTTTNKIIKYLAIGFVCFLTFLIIYTVAVGFYGLTELLFSNKKNDNDNLNQNKVCNYASSFNELDIDIKNSSLIIKTGDEFLVETNSENVSCKSKGNELVIKESKSSFFKTKDIKTVTIYIPNNMFLNEIDLETGVGKVNIDSLNTNNLELSFGVGDVLINEIKIPITLKIIATKTNIIGRKPLLIANFKLSSIPTNTNNNISNTPWHGIGLTAERVLISNNRFNKKSI